MIPSDAFIIWKNPRLIVLTAVSSAIYAAAYILFAPFSIHVIPGILSIAVRGILPLAMGLLFGPAGAWGVGIGNAIGDLFSGGLGLGAPFGFTSNFLLAYLAHRYWRGINSGTKGSLPVIFQAERGRAWQVLTFGLVAVLIAAASTMPLAWGLNFLGFVPFRVSVVSLSLNFALGNLASGLLFTLIAPRIARINMIWDAIVTPPRDAVSPVRTISRTVGVLLLAVGGVSGCLLGLVLDNSSAIPVGAVPFLAVLVGAVLI